jgi:hypothetical protein
MGMAFSVDSVWIAQWLLFSLFLFQVVGFIMQLVYYRRGV